VFLDEPTTGLDPISRDSIWRYVAALNRSEGVTFFLTTQYLEEADRLARLAIGLGASRGRRLEGRHRNGRDYRARRRRSDL
jgi:ABC-type uncharacterized transport system ATPase subunit